MVRDAVDVGIRVGALPETAGTARLIGTMHRVIVAAPAYLARHGTPEHPSDLSIHRIISGPAASRGSSWQFQRGDETASLDLTPHLSTNDTFGAIAAAKGGLCITSSTSRACKGALESGLLVRLFVDWKTVAGPRRKPIAGCPALADNGFDQLCPRWHAVGAELRHQLSLPFSRARRARAESADPGRL
ncbi:MAG: substrate binding domain-containing protein [Sphingomonas sp.]|nr:substrate binding domain-containing protein [Sphingomonas sp.]